MYPHSGSSGKSFAFVAPVECPVPPVPIARHRSARAPRSSECDVELHDNTKVDRNAVERFIRDRFEQTFGSRIHAFMPRLMSLRDARGNIRGAFGLRAAGGPLFLEQYIDRPIEAEILLRVGRECARTTVMEVGHLSGTYPGVVRTMIALLTQQLHEEGVRWVAFTGTAPLRNAFQRMGLSPQEIAVASRDRLPESERAFWGRYYDETPRVFIGNVREGQRLLRLSRRSAGSVSAP